MPSGNSVRQTGIDKKLTPGQPGTQRDQRQFGDAWVCVYNRAYPGAATLSPLSPSLSNRKVASRVNCSKVKTTSNEFIVIEVWTSVTAHQASVKNIPPEKLGAVMPMLASPPSGSNYAE